jgi:5'-3' exonuclease
VIKESVHGDEEFLYLDCGLLAKALYETYVPLVSPRPSQAEFIRDFVGLMNIMGNDFVPHGMGLKIRAGGIQILLEQYMRLPLPIVQSTADDSDGGDCIWNYNPHALQAYFEWLTAEEPTLFLESIKKKHTARPHLSAFARYTDTPVLWAAEKDMIHSISVAGREYPQLQLRADWKQTYETQALWDADPSICVKTYLESLVWTLAYYSGAPIDTNWYYPWFLPPLSERVLNYLKSHPIPGVPNTKQTPISPIEQLALVLPESSFHLLPAELQTLPKKYPYAWPVEWGYYSYGRRYMWECEPLIPLIQPKQIKQWIEIAYES